MHPIPFDVAISTPKVCRHEILCDTNTHITWKQRCKYMIKKKDRTRKKKVCNHTYAKRKENIKYYTPRSVMNVKSHTCGPQGAEKGGPDQA